MSYEDWAKSEVTLLAREMAAERAGLRGPAGDALAEVALIIDDTVTTEAGKARIEELGQLYTKARFRQSQEPRKALIYELPATLPSPETVAAASGGPCYRIKAAMLETTDEPVTEGKVEALLGWWQAYENKQFDGDRYGNLASEYPVANSHNRLDFKRANQ
jgi:hypothetical protein